MEPTRAPNPEPTRPMSAPEGWNAVGHKLRVRYASPSYTAGAAFTAAIAAAADELDHHPDITLRYGDVTVLTHSHDVGGITDRDQRLASRITALAREHGMTALPEVPQQLTIAIDTPDFRAIAPFWQAAYGLPPRDFGEADWESADIVPPHDDLPVVWFQESPLHAGRNRFHLDIHLPFADIPARLESATAAGGTLVTDEFAPSWWILADAEGNEICLCHGDPGSA